MLGVGDRDRVRLRGCGSGLSSRVIVDLLRWSGAQVDDHYANLGLAEDGSVIWAGNNSPPLWFDLCRDFTERWVHQQHISDAVRQPGSHDRSCHSCSARSSGRSPEGTAVGVDLDVPGWVLLTSRGWYDIFHFSTAYTRKGEDNVDLGLAGKNVLITGGSRGIGRAVARAFAAEGANVAISSRSSEDLAATAKDLVAETGGTVLPFAADWRDSEAVDGVVETVISEFGHLDVFVPNAGDAPPGQFETVDDDKWLWGLNLKFMGHIRGCRAVLPHMAARGQGVVTMVVGNDGLKPPFAEIVPGACNAADINVASSLAEQYGYRGIRVNTVNPGPVGTSRWAWCEEEMAASRGLTLEQVRSLILASLPRGYICTPEEVANVVLFLSSDRASYVSGAHVPVDGAQRKALMYADQHFAIDWS